ncbi:MAG: SatD family protein [Marivirga sp.]
MADIINSSDYSGAELMENFKILIKKANKLFEEQIISPLTITLGDEFQGVVIDLRTSIDLVFYLDQELLKADYQLRYALQLGEIETPVNEYIAHGMLGKGLTLARENLQYGKEEQKRFNISGYGALKNEMFNKSFLLYDHFYQKWSDTEKLIAFEFLSGKNYKSVAEIFQKDNSSMWRKEKSLNLKEFKVAKELIKLYLK